MNPVTLCITMGKRPALLKQTLQSLLSQTHFDDIIAINDFRDDATNQAFLEVCPKGRLISLDRQLGHHAAVDYMYGLVRTPWVFHCEDDWQFEKPIDLQRLIGIVQDHTWMTGICLRQRNDFALSEQENTRVAFEQYGGLDFYRLDTTHKQWHGYTFNPHIAPLALWQSVGPFAQFKKERHISRTLRKQGRAMPYWVDGGCSHLGADNSVSNPVSVKPSFWKRFFA